MAMSEYKLKKYYIFFYLQNTSIVEYKMYHYI